MGRGGGKGSVGWEKYGRVEMELDGEGRRGGVLG